MKFQVGDKVRRIKDIHMDMGVGDIGTIKETFGTTIKLKEWRGGHMLEKFVLVDNPIQKLKERLLK